MQLENNSNIRYISCQPIIARVVEELRSYFFAGAVDELLMNLWVRDCIDKFEYTYLPVRQCAMDLHNHKCELPCDFRSVREVWLCATFFKGPIRSPHVFYYQTDCRIDPAPRPADSCSDCLTGYQCLSPEQTPTEVALPSLCDVPSEYICTHKVMTTMNFSFQVTCMLKPGNFKTVDRCHAACANRDVWNVDTFDITGDKMITSFREGTVYMAYYGSYAMEDESGYYLIPDNDPFQKYVYKYLRYMIFKQVYEQSTEEGFQIARIKKQEAEQEMDEAYLNAKYMQLVLQPSIYKKTL